MFGTASSRYFLYMLIESGFPVSKKTLEDALAKPLHPTEHAYIIHCLSAPKSLMSRFRDILWRHFIHRQAHYYLDKQSFQTRLYST